MYSGPIPAPHFLKEYDEMDPGAAKQIIDNGVEESHHRRQMESRILDMNKKKVFVVIGWDLLLALLQFL